MVHKFHVMSKTFIIDRIFIYVIQSTNTTTTTIILLLLLLLYY